MNNEERELAGNLLALVLVGGVIISLSVGLLWLFLAFLMAL